jgi:putative hydrolase of the HAD superfamily
VTVRALLFDLDDTLIPERPAIEAGYAAVAERVWGAGSPERIAQLWEAARAVWHAGRPAAYARRVHFSLGEALHGEFVAVGPEADALRAFVPRLHATAFDAVLPPDWVGRSRELVELWKTTRMAALTVFPETVEVLDHWRARLPLALVTNGAARLQRDKLERLGLGEYFAFVVVSEDIGVGKPDPAMFATALDGLGGLDADSVVMVGNDPGRDVAGARAAGIRPIWVDRGDPAPDGEVTRITDLRHLTQHLG